MYTQIIMIIQALICIYMLSQVNAFPSNSSAVLNGRFLQITDIHLDPFYGSGKSTYRCHSNAKLGKYGDHACDAPIVLVKGVFDVLKEFHARVSFDFVLWNGDSNRHVVLIK